MKRVYSLVVLLILFLGFTQQNLLAQNKYKCEIDQSVQGGFLNLDFYIQRTSGSDFYLGSSNFSIYVTAANLNIDAMQQDYTANGPWDSNTDPNSYYPLSSGHGLDYVNLNVNEQTTMQGPGQLVTATRTRIGRIKVPITNPAGFNTVIWRIKPMALYSFSLQNIKSLGTFVNPAPNFPLCETPAIPILSALNGSQLCNGARTLLKSNFSGKNVWYLDGNLISNYDADSMWVSSAGNYTVAAQSYSCVSNQSPVIQIQTGTCSCPIATNLSALPDYTKAALSWTLNTDFPYYHADSCQVQIRKLGSSNWMTRKNATLSSLTVYLLDQNTTYEWRVRTFCGQGSSTFSSIGVFTTGAPCGTISNLVASNITTNSVALNWQISGAVPDSYQVGFRRAGENGWILRTATTNSITLNGLFNNQAYEWRVRSICASSNSIWTQPSNFNTLPGCLKPTNLTASNITITGATVSWDNLANADSFNVQYRVAGNNGNFIQRNTKTTSFGLVNLLSNTTYEWRVRGFCSGTTLGFSDNATFSTTIMKTIASDPDAVFRTYPNPNAGIFTVEFNLIQDASVKIKVSNQLGQTVYEASDYVAKGNYKHEINIASFEAGTYIVEVFDGSQTWVSKVVKSTY
ncbi:MAG: fibronectin type III domain-containing protein [Bacteroidia bacterium]|nr:fibronectin type III domain-containing protein [Bacteroidia bacterium]